MSKKIIFFDIDGTILSHRNYTISSSTTKAIRQARENGNLAFINTGRTFSEIDPEIKEVGFDGFVCGCGTYIYYNSSVLFHTTLEQSTRQKVIQDLQNFGLDAVMEGSTAIYFSPSPHNDKLKFVRDMYQQKGFQVSTWDDPEMIFDKFCIWNNFPEAADAFEQKYNDLFDFIHRDNFFTEIIPKGCSKATGIEYLLSHLNIPFENAYALGDSANDFTMLNYVKHSIGMGNSEEIIKQIVSYLTKDVDDNGVAHALKHFNII